MSTRQSKQEKAVPAHAAPAETAVPSVTSDPVARADSAIPGSPADEGLTPPATPEALLSLAPEAPLLIPGASVIGHGIFIRPGQPYELKASLFELDRAPAHAFTSWDTGERYGVPGHCMVNTSPPSPADQSLGETVIEESWERFGNELTLNVTAAVSSNLLSIDPSAFRATDVRSQEDSYYALRSSFIAFWHVSLLDQPEASALDSDVASLPLDVLDPSNRAAYARIFEKYGSHYIRSAWVGGKASLVFVVAKSSALTKEEVRAGIQASFGSIVKAGSSGEHKSVDDRFKSSSTCRVFGSGGDRIKLAKLSTLDPEAYGEWIESVKANPQIIQIGLAGIWTLVKDPVRAEALKMAYIQETSFKPLTAIIPVVMPFGPKSGVESRLYFVKDDDVFEYRLRQSLGTAKTTRNPEFVVKLRRQLEASPALSKFAKPDAAISLNGFPGSRSDAVYLFRHGECLRLDVGNFALTVAEGYPRKIQEDWPGVDFDRIDAALTAAPDKVYFFRGPRYVRVDMAAGQAPVVGTRDFIRTRWAGVVFDRLDTAVYWGDSKVYLFYENQYIRYDMAVCRADAGYPKFITSNYVEDWELFE